MYGLCKEGIIIIYFRWNGFMNVCCCGVVVLSFLM